MEFEISIATGSDVPIYRQIVDQVCRAIATGELAPGAQLPSVRALAEQLVINPNTVRKTYADLIREGILESHQGKGVFVARRRTVYTKDSGRATSIPPSKRSSMKACIWASHRKNCTRGTSAQAPTIHHHRRGIRGADMSDYAISNPESHQVFESRVRRARLES